MRGSAIVKLYFLQLNFVSNIYFPALGIDVEIIGAECFIGFDFKPYPMLPYEIFYDLRLRLLKIAGQCRVHGNHQAPVLVVRTEASQPAVDGRDHGVLGRNATQALARGALLADRMEE